MAKINDFIKLAQNMEIRGIEFYEKAFKLAQVEEVRETFRFLIEEEKEHVRFFEKLLEKDWDVEISAESSRYLKGIFDFPFLGEKELEEVSRYTREKEALELAAQAEKDAILFYQELSNVILDEKLKDAIGKIIEEEKMHLVAIRERIYELLSD
ncbi:rubrerythrin [Carboxydothermus islandicus]|uniref:Rubrerythrin n=1 Tax=Carboxydothermus islandicus TaxID=661089 RepID=A0A1L8D167_9THEO|nr:ferritin family protein [Carboxydothermus islandicus]GAV24884.1 rubrerythrin [Carboxydothermus islandicus]